jgi:hypothetical protein
VTPLNECTACRLDFASLRAFDLHRIGAYPQTGPSEYLDRMRAGLVDPLVDWRPELGRRCRDGDELVEVGLELDERNRWRLS